MRFISALLLSTFACQAVDHGPLVQWFHDPCHEAVIRWVDRTGFKAIEGEWALGRAGFGYGDNDDLTVFPGMEKNYRTVSIRKKITLAAQPEPADELFVDVLYDDGFVMFIDGKEVLRKNCEGNDAEIEAKEGHEAKSWETFSLGQLAVQLKTGSIIAVQGVNDRLESSDFSLNLRLRIKGKKNFDVIAKDDVWEYLVKQLPEADWKTTTNQPDAVPWKAEASYSVGYRQAGKLEYTWQPASSHQFSNADANVFTSTLTNLSADTKYEFSIREDASKNLKGPFAFITAPVKFRPMHFVIGGDMYHTLPLLNAMNACCGKEDPLFAALIGDLAYTNNNNPDRWYQWIDSWVQQARSPDGRLIPMVIGIGNHEVVGQGFFPEKNTPEPDKATEFYSLFQMASDARRPIAHYSIEFGDYLSLLLLDSGHTERISAQTSFVEAELTKLREKTFTFAAYHRPAWGSGCKEDAVDIQQKWSPLFETLGADAVFEHDHHTYKRTWPLTGGKRDDASGIPYLGDGAWGVEVRAPSKAELAKRPWVAKQAPLNHLIRVDLTADGFTCTAKTADGKAFDSATYPKRK